MERHWRSLVGARLNQLRLIQNSARKEETRRAQTQEGALAKVVMRFGMKTQERTEWKLSLMKKMAFNHFTPKSSLVILLTVC